MITDNNTWFSSNFLSASSSLLRHAAPTTPAPLLPPTAENLINTSQPNNNRGDNNTCLSPNLCASQNNNTITDNSITIDKSTAALTIIANNYNQTSIAQQFGKKKKRIPTKSSVNTSQGRFSFTKMKDFVDVYKCFKLPTGSCIPPVTQLEHRIKVYANIPKSGLGS